MKYIEVVAAIIIKDGKIFATQRGSGQFEGGWEFPGGKMEPGETKEEALIREIKEELNTDIKVIREIGTVKHQYPNFHLTMHCFICNVLFGDLELLEHSASKWVDKTELDTVDWIPADITAVEYLKKALSEV